MVLHYVIFIELFLVIVNYNLTIRCECVAAKMLFCKKKKKKENVYMLQIIYSETFTINKA